MGGPQLLKTSGIKINLLSYYVFIFFNAVNTHANVVAEGHWSIGGDRVEQQKEPLAHVHVPLDPLWVQAMIFYMQRNVQQDNAHHT